MYESSILTMLKEVNRGLLGQELRKRLQIDNKTKLKKFNNSITKLDTKISSISRKGLPKHFVKENPYEIDIKPGKIKRSIYFLSENEPTVNAYWETESANPHKIEESDNIECGFLLIRQEFLKQKKGSIQPIKNYLNDKKLGARGLLDGFKDIDDNYDYLFFWTENGNNSKIEETIASIYIPPLFYNPVKNGECYKSKYYKSKYYIDNYSIRIICEELFDWQKPMSKDRAYALIPLERKQLDDTYDHEEQIPIVKVQYKDKQLKHIKGGEVTFPCIKGSSYIEIL